ncbi:hypothetical protein D3C80_1465210 [compost metagenome]
MKDVVAQDQAHRIIADELLANQEGLCQAIGRGLLGIGKSDAELAAVAEQLAILGQVLRCRDQQDFADIGEHQHRNRVVDHRFVVNRQQLLGDPKGDGVQACAGSSGQDDALGHAMSSLMSVLPRRSPW